MSVRQFVQLSRNKPRPLFRVCAARAQGTVQSFARRRTSNTCEGCIAAATAPHSASAWGHHSRLHFQLPSRFHRALLLQILCDRMRVRRRLSSNRSMKTPALHKVCVCVCCVVFELMISNCRPFLSLVKFFYVKIRNLN